MKMRFALSMIAAGSPITSCTASADPLVDDLQTLVNLNSGSVNAAGVNQVQDWVAGRLQKLGFNVELIPHLEGDKKSGRLLVGTLKGKDERIISFIGHADTVFEPSSAFQKFILSADGKTATGPGVVDDKGGLIVGLAALDDYLKAATPPQHTLRFIVSPSEEIGTLGFVDQLKKFAADTWLTLGIEPGMEDGSIVQSRRGNRWYQIFVTGKEAHAGRDHTEGVNACVELSAKLAEIAKLTNYASEVTVNVGHISGGQDKFNIVCGSAEAKVDTRFSKLSARDALDAKIRAILKRPGVRSPKTGEPAQVRFEIADDTPPFSAAGNGKAFVAKYLKAVESAEGKAISAKSSAGVADSNYFSREGGIVLDGLGPIGGKMHTEEEFIFLPSLGTRAKALATFLRGI